RAGELNVQPLSHVEELVLDHGQDVGGGHLRPGRPSRTARSCGPACSLGSKPFGGLTLRRHNLTTLSVATDRCKRGGSGKLTHYPYSSFFLRAGVPSVVVKARRPDFWGGANWLRLGCGALPRSA